jgi:hypothetical protein
METPTYIKALLVNNSKKAPQARRVWSIDLETVWLPFFTATNVMGDTTVPADALGAPLRLKYGKDGTVRFSATGRPVVRVSKDLSDNIRLIRENFTAGLMAYSHGVSMENAEAWKAEVMKDGEAGKPIVTHDNEMLSEAIAKVMSDMSEAQTKAKAEAKPKAEKPKAKAKAKAPKAPAPTTTPAPAPADTIPADVHGNGANPDTDKVLATV